MLLSALNSAHNTSFLLCTFDSNGGPGKFHLLVDFRVKVSQGIKNKKKKEKKHHFD